MKTEPPKETIRYGTGDVTISDTEQPPHFTIGLETDRCQMKLVTCGIKISASQLTTLAKEKADAGDMAKAAILQEQSDALLAVVEKLKEAV